MLQSNSALVWATRLRVFAGQRLLSLFNIRIGRIFELNGLEPHDMKARASMPPLRAPLLLGLFFELFQFTGHGGFLGRRHVVNKQDPGEMINFMLNSPG